MYIFRSICVGHLQHVINFHRVDVDDLKFFGRGPTTQ